MADGFTINPEEIKYPTYDHDLMKIIREESAPFFNGDKTVDECVEIIQSRASVLIAER